MTIIAFEAMSASHGAAESGPGLEVDVLADPAAPSISLTDRSIVTPNIVRYLLNRYRSCFSPHYNLLEQELLGNDGVSFKKLEDVAKVKILLACATAAAYEAYRLPGWLSMAQTCRDWAGELITPILSAGDRDAVTTTIMLLVFELAEPSRGLAWDLLNLATRMCLQLGWLHRPRFSNPTSSSTASAPAELDRQDPSDQERVLATLRYIDRYNLPGHDISDYINAFYRTLQGIFHRPSMLHIPKPAIEADDESQTNAFGIHTQVYDEIYGQGGVFESRACPFIGKLAGLLGLLDGLQTHQCCTVLEETLLLLLPVCVKHKQCISCFQEPDEPLDAKGMKSLRHRVVESASQVISKSHASTLGSDKFEPPFAACIKVFSAGCCLVTAAVKGWTPLRACTKDIIKCTEVLTFFSTQWKGGRRYLDVWRTLRDFIDFT